MESSSSSRRRRPLRDLLGDDDLEEGEYVPGGYDSSDTDDDRYRFEPRPQHGRRMRRLEDIVGAAGRRGILPSSESEETISDDDRISAGAPAPKFACHVCGKPFRSPKAVGGHMRVHGAGRHEVPAVVAVSLGLGWTTTRKRGWAGGKPAVADASLNSEGHSTALVAVQPMEPVPMAIAATNLSPAPSSTRTDLSSEDGTSSASAGARLVHTEPLAAAPTVVHQPSPAAAAPPPPAAAEQAPQVVPPPQPAQKAQLVPQPVAPPRAVQQARRLVPLPADPPQIKRHRCKICGKEYPTHQALGGHAAGHRSQLRRAQAVAAAGVPHGGGELLAGPEVERPHPCQKCDRVFPTGVALGGHMRVHYTGPKIGHKEKKRCMAPPPELVVVAAPPPAAPAVPGRLRLFGIDIGPLEQAPSEKLEPDTTEGSSSAGDHHHHQ